MKRLLISAVLAGAATTFAVPVSAQDYGRGHGYDYGYGRYDPNFERELGRIEYRIRRMLAERRLSRREGGRLLYQVNQLDLLADRYRRGGMTLWERRDLEHRLARLRENARFALASRWDRRWNDADRDHDTDWDDEGFDRDWDEDDDRDDDDDDRDDDEDDWRPD